MLKELRQYDNLGTTNYFWEVLALFYNQPSTDWSKDSITAHFKGRIVDGKDIIDGGFHLLQLAGILEVDIAGFYHPTYNFRQSLQTQEHCKGRILEAVLMAMQSDDETYDIFSSEFCSFDMVNSVIQVDKSAFALQYANIRDLLLNLDFLLPHPNFPQRCFAINKSRRNLFDRFFAHEMRRRHISPEQLQSALAHQQENGLLGEQFVYDYEGLRTNRGSGIEWIARYDISAGFDIMSFETETSVDYDRFIEVKSYSGENPYFYWSKNEMKVAEGRGKQYFLYLVNLNEIKNSEYVPIIIMNPTVEVLQSSAWDKTVDKYHIFYVG